MCMRSYQTQSFNSYWVLVICVTPLMSSGVQSIGRSPKGLIFHLVCDVPLQRTKFCHMLA